MDLPQPDVAAGLVQLEAILPAQLEVGARGRFTPEQRLMLAILEEAVRCLRRYGRSRHFREAVQWFLSEQRDWPFSFERICDVLDLDPHRARRGLGLVPPERPDSP